MVSDQEYLAGLLLDCTPRQLAAIAAQIGAAEPTLECVSRTRAEQLAEARAAKRRKVRAYTGLRYMALRRAGGRCDLCGASAKDGARLQVDHIKPFSKHPELGCDPDNLQVLCHECNAGKGNEFEDDWR